MDLLSDLKKGKRGAIAKAITIVENDQKETRKLLKKIFKFSCLIYHGWHLVHIEDDNSLSQKFLLKLGFHKGEQADWIEHIFEKKQ